MALIKCPKCGSEISDKALKCVHCGIESYNDYKIEDFYATSKTSNKYFILIVSILLIIVGLILLF